MTDNLTSAAPAGLVERAKAIMLRPRAEWPRIATETAPPREVLIGYAAPLAAIGPIAALIGGQLFGYGAFGISFRPDLVSGLTTAIIGFILALCSLFVDAWVANFLSPKFGGKSDFSAAFRLMAYAMTAAWVAGIFGLVPSLGILGLLGLYSLYLFYLGATPMMGVPQDKATGYTVVTVLVAIVINIAAAAVAASLTAGLGMATLGGGAPAALGDADNVSMDLGELGQVEVNGNTTTITRDGHTTTITADGDKAKLSADGETVDVTVPQQD